jgi:Flp pilus assembly protein TadB
MPEMPEVVDREDQHESAEHLPGPSFWPIVLALGTAVTLTGVVTKLAFVIVGLVVVVVALGGWLWVALHDYRELR